MKVTPDFLQTKSRKYLYQKNDTSQFQFLRKSFLKARQVLSNKTERVILLGLSHILIKACDLN